MEDRTHPATKNMPAMFQIRDEWYEFSGNPRGKVRVLGKADESTYTQVKKMGDHPMIWTQEKYPRAIYTATGHDASDWQNTAFTTLIRDSLLWAAGRLGAPGDDGGTDGAVDVSGEAAADVPRDVAMTADAGSGGAPGSGGAEGPKPDSAVGSGGAGGSATGSGGATGSGSGGAGGTPTAGGGSSCRVAGEGTAADRGSASLLILIGLGLAARRRRRTS
jgi:MYXO-CTERM domain-containing protein